MLNERHIFCKVVADFGEPKKKIIHEYASFPESMVIDNHKNKWIDSIMLMTLKTDTDNNECKIGILFISKKKNIKEK